MTTLEDTPVEIDITATDADGLSYIVVKRPQHGTVTGAGPTFTYTPAQDYNGDDAFLVGAGEDPDAASALARISITPVDDAPVANSDAFLDAFDQPLVLQPAQLLANDTDVDSAELAVAGVTPIAHGAVAIDASGVITFTPDRGFAGTATFGYAVTDGMLDDATTVAVTITHDLPPTAIGDDAMTFEDTPVAIDVLANDVDPDGDAIAIAAVTTPHHGTAVIDAGRLTYTPSANYNGADSFTYVVSDGRGGAAIGAVGVTIAPVNDPPVATADSVITPVDTPVAIAAATLLANDTDVDGDALVITAVGAPVRGAVALSGQVIAYTPPVHGGGVDSFAYTIADGHGGTASATVTVAIAPVEHSPNAVDDTATTAEDVSLAIPTSVLLANDTDPDGNALIVTAVSDPASCTVTLSGTTIDVTPAPSFDGIASFTYTISDGHGRIARARVAVAVTPVNDAPIANDDTATTAEDTPLQIAAAVLLGNDTDVDRDTLTVTSVGDAASCAVALAGTTITVTPAAAFVGTATFTYAISDGHGGTASARVAIAVASVEHAPIASDGAASTAGDAPVDIPLIATDPDGDPLSFAVATPPANGTVTIAGSIATYTPSSGFTGADTFTFVANDGFESSNAASIAIGDGPQLVTSAKLR